MKHDDKKDEARPEGPNHAKRHGGARHRGEGGRRHGRGGRANRLFDYGELRLLILAMVAERPRHGYELIKEISDRFEGRYCPSPGVIYPTLAWLEDMGYVTILAADSGRKLTNLTPEGAAFLTANRAAADELLVRELPMGRPEGIPPKIEAAMDALKAALRARSEGGLADATEIEDIAAAIRSAADTIGAKR